MSFFNMMLKHLLLFIKFCSCEEAYVTKIVFFQLNLIAFGSKYFKSVDDDTEYDIHENNIYYHKTQHVKNPTKEKSIPIQRPKALPLNYISYTA